MGSATFPLFANHMFRALTYKWANVLFAGVALVIVPIPFVSRHTLVLTWPSLNLSQLLFFYGSFLRKRSPLCSTLMSSDPGTSNINLPHSSD